VPRYFIGAARSTQDPEEGEQASTRVYEIRLALQYDTKRVARFTELRSSVKTIYSSVVYWLAIALADTCGDDVNHGLCGL
jgi:hypothetical protein